MLADARKLASQIMYQVAQGRELAVAAVTGLALLACLGARAEAAQCGSTAAAFDAWKREFAEEARAKGMSGSSVAALMQANYASATIAADLVLSIAGTVWQVMTGVVLWGLHMGATQGLLSALVADAVPADLRGTAFGFYSLITGVSLLAASVVAGWLWTIAGPGAAFYGGRDLCGSGANRNRSLRAKKGKLS